MKERQLVEKHLALAGLGRAKVTWATMGAGAAANDALLSGNLHFASGGTGPAIILWDRTRANVDVRGVAALSSMPNLLITRNPDGQDDPRLHRQGPHRDGGRRLVGADHLPADGDGEGIRHRELQEARRR